MKKIIVFTVLAMLVVSSLAAQNIERIVAGTWTDDQNQTWVFNADGSFTGSNNTLSGRFTGTQLAGNLTRTGSMIAFNFSISSDGRTMILTRHGSDEVRLLRKN